MRATLPLVADLRVECYAGGRADEEPRRIVEGGRPFEVVEVLDRARTPTELRFHVRLADGRRCRLVQSLSDGLWRVEAP